METYSCIFFLPINFSHLNRFRTQKCQQVPKNKTKRSYQIKSFYTGEKTNPVTSATQNNTVQNLYHCWSENKFPSSRPRPALWVSEKATYEVDYCSDKKKSLKKFSPEKSVSGQKLWSKESLNKYQTPLLSFSIMFGRQNKKVIFSVIILKIYTK